MSARRPRRLFVTREEPRKLQVATSPGNLSDSGGLASVQRVFEPKLQVVTWAFGLSAFGLSAFGPGEFGRGAYCGAFGRRARVVG